MRRFMLWVAIVAAVGAIAVVAGAVVFLWRGPARPSDVQDWRVLRQWAAGDTTAPATGAGPTRTVEPYYVRVPVKVVENGEWGEGYRVRMEGLQEGFYYHIASEMISREHREFNSLKPGDTLVVEGWVRALRRNAADRVDFYMDHPRVVQ